MTEKIFLDNPYIRQIDTNIVHKEYSNNKYHIKTKKTIFYPNLSNGQPGDKGTINGIEILDIYEDGDDIVHVLGENILNDKVKLSIDWDNRIDYMQQHSGQHLLSAVFYKLYSGKTIKFHIGKDISYIDIDISNIEDKEIHRIEQFANKIIYSNFSIKSYIIGKEDANRLPIRDKTIESSRVRIVEIDGIDFSPCGGTHLSSTGEIGIIKIKNIQSDREHVRVEFLCGYRALADYSNLAEENKILQKQISQYKK